VAIDFSIAVRCPRPCRAWRAADRRRDRHDGLAGARGRVPANRRPGRHRRDRAANFAIGLHIFRRAVREAAARFAAQPDIGRGSTNRITPARRTPRRHGPPVAHTMAESGYTRPVDLSSTRAGSIPGTHTWVSTVPSETSPSRTRARSVGVARAPWTRRAGSEARRLVQRWRTCMRTRLRCGTRSSRRSRRAARSTRRVKHLARRTRSDRRPFLVPCGNHRVNRRRSRRRAAAGRRESAPKKAAGRALVLAAPVL